MNQQFILEFLAKQRHLFLENYSIALKTLDGDAVHDLRVSVKRLKTLLRMLNFSEKANYRLKQSSFPIRFIYREFGKLRDRQVLKALLLEYQQVVDANFSLLFQKFEIQKKKEIEYFWHISDYFQIIFAKKSFQLIEHHVQSKSLDLLRSNLSLFKESCEKRFELFKNPNSKKHDLHKARRQVKDIGNLLELAGNEIAGFSLKIDEYKEIGSLLGNWHDRQVLYRYLLNQKSLANENKSNYEKILEAVYKDKEKLRRDFYVKSESLRVTD